MRLYLDANAIIYAIEGVPALRKAVLTRVEQAESEPEGLLITSTLSLLECRVKPLRDGRAEALALFDRFFERDRLLIAEVTREVIAQATELRARHAFKTADAIHLAAALTHQASVFLTADPTFQRFSGLEVALIDPAFP